MTIEQELKDLVAKLEKCGEVFYQNRQRVSALGGAYLSAAAEASAPKSKKVHYRYGTSKLTNSIRAPKGLGTKIASYTPGNLGRSINVLKFSRAKSKVFVGAKLSRNSRGRFSGKRADGYYMHFVEKGTVKMAGTDWFSNTWERSKGRVFGIMKQEFERIGRQFENQNRIA